MFGSVGAPEILLILIVALLVFGPRKLPELGRALGRSISEFRRATADLRSTLERELSEEEVSIRPAAAGPETPPVSPHDAGPAGGEHAGRDPD